MILGFRVHFFIQIGSIIALNNQFKEWLDSRFELTRDFTKSDYLSSSYDE